ncbi:MAG TPA: ECF-type sigma factor [Planctomycetota bacterium]
MTPWVEAPGPEEHRTRKCVEGMDVDALLERLKRGEFAAREQLLDVVYEELRRIARRVLAGNSNLLGTTSLVHEVYLKLFRREGCDWATRAHFLATAARAMRQVVVDRFRHEVRHIDHLVPLEEGATPLRVKGENVLALDEALRRLAGRDPQLVRVIEMRFFAGYSIADTARILDVSPRTVVRQWEIGRAWLVRELTNG